ncbi:nucleotidyltransferase family protein [Profundibacter sp.]
MQITPDTLMLFAAGFGTRMGGLTTNCPKPLIKVANKALIDHALEIVEEAGIETIIANTHYLPELLKSHLANRNVILSHEAEILETGGGLKHALPLLGTDPVFTLNTDAIWTGSNPLMTLASAWDPGKMDALLLLVSRANAKGYSASGDFLQADDGTIKRGHGDVYTGAQIIKTDGLKSIPEDKFSLHSLWDQMYDAGRIFGVMHGGGWCDVGSPAGIEIAEIMLEKYDV